MNGVNILKNFFRQIKTQGLLAATRSLSHKMYVRFQEWRLSISTEDIIELRELGIDNKECKHYGATDYASIRKIMHTLALSPSEHVFLDFGAGMGRAMILAAMYPFRRVMGVEISPELVEIAKRNFARCEHKLRCREIEIITSDATKYDIPNDVTVVYFNNPFFGHILESVLNNLRMSLEAAPRNLWVVCNLPQQSAFESQIARHEWLSLQTQFTFPDKRRCFIYHSVLGLGVIRANN